MSIKSIPKLFDLTCKNHSFLTQPRILNMWALIPKSSTIGQTTCHVMETNFLEWYEQQKTKAVRNKQYLLACCMDEVNILRQAC